MLGKAMSQVPINEVKVGDTSVFVRREDLYIDQLPEGINLRGIEFDIGQIGVDPPPTGKARGILSSLIQKYPEKEIYSFCRNLNYRTQATYQILVYYAHLLGKHVTIFCDDEVIASLDRPTNKAFVEYCGRLNCHFSEVHASSKIEGAFFNEYALSGFSMSDVLSNEIDYMCTVEGLLIDPATASLLTAIVVPIVKGDTIVGIIDGLMRNSVRNVRVIGVLTDTGKYWDKYARRIICSRIGRMFATPWCVHHLTLRQYTQMIPIKQVAKECPFPADPQSSLRAWSMLISGGLMDLVDISPRVLFWNTSG